ncbi:hypothetical protein F5Y16DRAFT_401559 [Xylariaceae sp. FL0255]|nr:hypothetical protein F5Y16DRAFT_401559 [Xylariaceae sp. FL0255]
MSSGLHNNRNITGLVTAFSKMTSKSTESHIERIPNEIKIMIIENLFDEPQDLWNLGLTCPVFRSLIFCPSTVAATKVKKEVEPKLMRLVISVNVALAHTERRGSIQFFTWAMRAYQQGPPAEMTLYQASKIVQRHGAISFYAAILSAEALLNHPKRDEDWYEWKGLPDPASHNELMRFKNALYIYELACNILPERPNLSLYSDCALIKMRPHDSPFPRAPPRDSPWANFLVNFAPWECQQMRCIEILLPAHLNAFFTNAVGYQLVPVLDATDLRRFAAATGLVALHRLECGKDRHFYDSRFTVHEYIRPRLKLYPFYVPGNPSNGFEYWSSDPYRHHVDGDRLWFSGEGSSNMAVRIMSITETYDINGHFPDTDPGPINAWVATLNSGIIFRRSIRDDAFNCENCMTLWAFVFWDRSRLDTEIIGSIPTRDAMLDEIKSLPAGFAIYDMFGGSMYRQVNRYGCRMWHDRWGRDDWL